MNIFYFLDTSKKVIFNYFPRMKWDPSLTYITASVALTETDLLKLMMENPWLKWADWNWLADTNLLKLTDRNCLTDTH